MGRCSLLILGLMCVLHLLPDPILGLKCQVCNSKTDKGCEDKGDSKFLIDCNEQHGYLKKIFGDNVDDQGVPNKTSSISGPETALTVPHISARMFHPKNPTDATFVLPGVYDICRVMYMTAPETVVKNTKLTAIKDGSRVFRSCGRKHADDHKMNECKKQKTKETSYIYCICNKDNCNGATKGVAISGILVAVCSLSFLKTILLF